MKIKLFTVFLGGKAEKCNTELHDVVFVAAPSIKKTFPALLEKWFGIPDGLHIDSWFEVKNVDGYKVSLTKEDLPASDKKLFFVNLGAYDPEVFGEVHAYSLLVANDLKQAKKRAKETILKGKLQIHTDRIFEIDDVTTIDEVEGYKIILTYTGEDIPNIISNKYFFIPENIIEEYKSKNRK